MWWVERPRKPCRRGARRSPDCPQSGRRAWLGRAAVNDWPKRCEGNHPARLLSGAGGNAMVYRRQFPRASGADSRAVRVRWTTGAPVMLFKPVVGIMQR